MLVFVIYYIRKIALESIKNKIHEILTKISKDKHNKIYTRIKTKAILFNIDYIDPLLLFLLTQYSEYCFCGNSYGDYGKLAESECNMPCRGNIQQMCGAGMRNNIYETVKGLYLSKP